MEIRWDTAALDDLEATLNYLETEFSFTSARNFRAKIVTLTQKLVSFPQIGKHEPLLTTVLDGRIRSIPINKLSKLIYIEINNDVLLIIALWNTRQNPDEGTAATIINPKNIFGHCDRPIGFIICKILRRNIWECHL